MDDLRGPAETIKHSCEVLLSETIDFLNEQQQDSVRTIHTSIQRFLERTHEFQDDINRMRAGLAYIDLSHELRSPLTTIFGYNHLVLSGMLGLVSEQQQALLRQIETSGTALRHAVEQIFLRAQLSQDNLTDT